MMNTERHDLLADQRFLQEQLSSLPAKAVLTRMSMEARRQAVANRLDELASSSGLQSEAARATLTFSGNPVQDGHGIAADFGMRAVSSFNEAVTTMAASMQGPLAATGPIPNRDQHQLLITRTAIGSFGFELEERDAGAGSREDGAVAAALDRVRALLQGSMGSDEELADIAVETDRRAVEKTRSFLKVLVDHDAVCSLQIADSAFRFTDVSQVQRSLQRLAADNLREKHVSLEGCFTGLLPMGRRFEFCVGEQGPFIRGKVAHALEEIATLNQHLGEWVTIDLMVTQVGDGPPRYLLLRLPEWPQQRSIGA